MVDVARARVRKETFLATQAAAWGGHASTVRKLLSIQDISEVDDMDDGDAEESRRPRSSTRCSRATPSASRRS